jgi:hypothetical protein
MKREVIEFERPPGESPLERHFLSELMHSTGPAPTNNELQFDSEDEDESDSQE